MRQAGPYCSCWGLTLKEAVSWMSSSTVGGGGGRAGGRGAAGASSSGSGAGGGSAVSSAAAPLRAGCGGRAAMLPAAGSAGVLPYVAAGPEVTRAGRGARRGGRAESARDAANARPPRRPLVRCGTGAPRLQAACSFIADCWSQSSVGRGLGPLFGGASAAGAFRSSVRPGRGRWAGVTGIRESQTEVKNHQRDAGAE